MNSFEPPDAKVPQLVSRDASSWELEFVNRSERFFVRQAWKLAANVAVSDCRRIMTSAFVQALASSGANQDEIDS
jgi:hypothetical protein